MKRILAFDFLNSIVQTVFYSLLLALVYLTITPNQKLIIGTVFPFIILAFFIIVFIQNVLTSILNRKTFSRIFSILSVGIFSFLIFNPFRIWLSLLFCLLIVLILLIPNFIKKHFLRIQTKTWKQLTEKQKRKNFAKIRNFDKTTSHQHTLQAIWGFGLIEKLVCICKVSF